METVRLSVPYREVSNYHTAAEKASFMNYHQPIKDLQWVRLLFFVPRDSELRHHHGRTAYPVGQAATGVFGHLLENLVAQNMFGEQQAVTAGTCPRAPPPP